MSSKNSKNNRESQLDSVSTVLHKLLKNSKSPLSSPFIRWQVWHSWKDIVGENLAKHSTPVGYLKGILYIWVDHSSRMQEMLFLAKPIREKVNVFVGKNWVNIVRFTLDRKSVPTSAQQVEEMRHQVAEISSDDIS